MADRDIATLKDIRATIDMADEIILKGLSARFRGIEFLRRLKKSDSLRISDPAREQELKARWKKLAKEMKVPEPLALLILDVILVESKRLQES